MRPRSRFWVLRIRVMIKSWLGDSRQSVERPERVIQERSLWVETERKQKNTKECFRNVPRGGAPKPWVWVTTQGTGRLNVRQQSSQTVSH